MLPLRFTDEAAADLDAIADYTIEHFGVSQTETYQNGFDRAFGRLAQTPRLGSNQDHILPNLRRYVHEAHTIYYALRTTEIVIIRILGPGHDPIPHFG